jgi:hypothetical protein
MPLLTNVILTEKSGLEDSIPLTDLLTPKHRINIQNMYGFTFLYLYTQSSFLQEVLQQEQLITPEIRKSA